MSQGESERVKNTFQLTIVRRKSISNDASQKIKIYTKETVLHNFIINLNINVTKRLVKRILIAQSKKKIQFQA